MKINASRSVQHALAKRNHRVVVVDDCADHAENKIRNIMNDEMTDQHETVALIAAGLSLPDGSDLFNYFDGIAHWIKTGEGAAKTPEESRQ